MHGADRYQNGGWYALSMKPERRWALIYLALVALVFLGFYVGLEVRELGLAILMVVLNLPASALIVPMMVNVGPSAGSPTNVWSTQAVVMASNGVLVLLLRRFLGRWLDR